MDRRTRNALLALGGVILVACLCCVLLVTLLLARAATNAVLSSADRTSQPVAVATEEVTPRPTRVTTPTVGGERGRVTRVIDGDTIEVTLNGRSYRVRYIGMDTPERGDPFFSEATEANRRLVEGQEVLLERDVSETDRYGRLLRYVYLTDGTFVNAELLRQGFAQVLTYPPDVRFQEMFLQLQREARQAGRGLWAGVGVEPLLEPTEAAPSRRATGNVQITFIFFDGRAFRNEHDEYAEITNLGDTAVNLAGWRLNADDPGQDFWFPPFELRPGQSCRIYTDEVHPETCGFSFDYGRAIWNNGGDCGHLYDPTGAEVSAYCY